MAEALRIAESGCIGTTAAQLESALARCEAAGLGIPVMVWKHRASEEGQAGARLLRTVHCLLELKKRL